MVEPDETPKSEILPRAENTPAPMPSINFGIGIGATPSAVDTLVKKMTEQQIDKLLDHGAEQTQRTQLYLTIVVCLFIVAGSIVCCVFVLAGSATQLKDIILIFIGTGGGYAGGRFQAALMKPK
jgi:hypothetical protein